MREKKQSGTLSSYDVQIKPIQIFLEGKVSFSITYRRRQCEIIFWCLSLVLVPQLELKNCIFGSIGNNSLI